MGPSADFPVLLVRSSAAAHALGVPHEGRPRTVLITLDGSPESESICSWARKHVLLKRDAVVLLHAKNPLSEPHPQAAINKQVKELERCKGILQATGDYASVEATAIDVTHGHDLRDQLISFVESHQPPIDLLVMASAQRRVTTHKVLGSTTSYAAKFAQVNDQVTTAHDADSISSLLSSICAPDAASLLCWPDTKPLRPANAHAQCPIAIVPIEVLASKQHA